MQLALDPYLFGAVPLPDLPGLGADLGYEHLELSPWDEFMPSFLHRVPAAPPSPGSSRGSTGS